MATRHFMKQLNHKSKTGKTVMEIEGWKIESGIPAPQRMGNRYPFKHLKVGQSFLVAGRKDAGSVRVYAVAFSKANKGYRFTSAAELNGIRVWRINGTKK